MRRYRDRAGTVALEWCGVAYVALLLVYGFSELLSAVPVLGLYLVGVSVLCAALSTGVGIYAVIRVGWMKRGPRREVLAGVAALVLCSPLTVGAVWLLVAIAG